ncbi:hypothetical protein PIB30_037577 [Stylosanthes scabra]|uniref:Transmembrane protein n=1 Tax=Stylosanthes scabra TaxID=79078 RepID=A0ABU6VD25_9FABA|nr:hypothetical protein [Stylosanthes scabra]
MTAKNSETELPWSLAISALTLFSVRFSTIALLDAEHVRVAFRRPPTQHRGKAPAQLREGANQIQRWHSVGGLKPRLVVGGGSRAECQRCSVREPRFRSGIIIKYRVLASVLIFIVMVHLLLFSTFCSGHEQLQTPSTLSRKLLLSSSSSLDSVSKVTGKLIKKQTKKAVEQDLRKAPSSVPNPTQNK